MKYLRPDVILKNVGETYMLVALRSAWKDCPFIMEISPLSAYFCDCLSNKMPESQILENVRFEKPISPERLKRIYDKFIEFAEDKHYLVEGEGS